MLGRNALHLNETTIRAAIAMYLESIHKDGHCPKVMAVRERTRVEQGEVTAHVVGAGAGAGATRMFVVDVEGAVGPVDRGVHALLSAPIEFNNDTFADEVAA